MLRRGRSDDSPFGQALENRSITLHAPTVVPVPFALATLVVSLPFAPRAIAFPEETPTIEGTHGADGDLFVVSYFGSIGRTTEPERVSAMSDV